MSKLQHLRRIHGPSGDQVIHLTHGARLGRASDNEIVVDEDGISRHHCAFLFEGEQLAIKDLGSTNGVFVNGRRVTEAPLGSGDLLLIGRATFVVGGTLPPILEHDTKQFGSETIQIAFSAAQSEYRAQGIDGAQAEAHIVALVKFLDGVPRARRPEDLFESALHAIVEALAFTYGAAFVAPDFERPAHVRTTRDRAKKLEPSHTLLRRAVEQKEAILATGELKDPELIGAASLALAPAMTILCAPIVLGDDVLGAFYFADRSSAVTGDRELRLVSVVARTLALALETLKQGERNAAEVELHRAARSEKIEIVAESSAMKQALSLAERAARTDATVLILGETGTGKEVLASAVHQWSPRSAKPFVAINCGAIPSQMIESELFGHEKGAFTGALERRLGRFELADGGTLFLDEIGDLPLEAQVKLLRVIEEQRFYRVGGSKEVRVDVRLIAATNRDLMAEVNAQRFRSDLLYRIRVVEIAIPPLRERREDIAEIANQLLLRTGRIGGERRLRISDAAAAALERYPWPGNVREMRNVLERAAILARGDTIGVDDLALVAASTPKDRTPTVVLDTARERMSLEDLEKEHIQRVLESTGWNKVRAAEILGIGRTNLYEKIRLFGLKPSE